MKKKSRITLTLMIASAIAFILIFKRKKVTERIGKIKEALKNCGRPKNS